MIQIHRSVLVAAAVLAASASAFAEPVGRFTLSQAADQSLNLMTSTDIPMSITAAADYSGTVQLRVVRTDLDAKDKQQDVAITLVPDSVQLTAGQKADFVARVVVQPTAPDFKDAQFTVEAVDSRDPNSVTRSDTRLAVNAVLNIDLHGGPAPEKWDIANAIQLRRHAKGVVVRFNNKDTVQHLIHSNGAGIPHQDISDDQGQPGATYEVTVADGEKPVTAKVYCHLHEDSENKRMITFNALPQ